MTNEEDGSGLTPTVPFRHLPSLTVSYFITIIFRVNRRPSTISW